MEGGGIEIAEATFMTSENSGEGNCRQTQIKAEEVASFTLTASGDKSVSLCFLRNQIGDVKMFLSDAIGDFLAGTSTSGSSTTSDSPNPSTENLQPFLPFRQQQHFAFPGTTSQSFFTSMQ